MAVGLPVTDNPSERLSLTSRRLSLGWGRGGHYWPNRACFICSTDTSRPFHKWIGNSFFLQALHQLIALDFGLARHLVLKERSPPLFPHVEPSRLPPVARRASDHARLPAIHLIAAFSPSQSGRFSSKLHTKHGRGGASAN